MNCRKEWSRDIQIREITQTFVNGPLKKHMGNVLFDSQRALMPETLEEYERSYKLKQARTAHNVAYNDKERYLVSLNYYTKMSRYAQLNTEINFMNAMPNLTESEQDAYIEKVSEFNEIQQFNQWLKTDPKYVELDRIYKSKLKSYRDIREQVTNLVEKAPVNKAEPRFNRACPAEGCRGFLTSQWKCGLCDVSTCPDCLTVKSEDHICNPDDVASAQLMAKDTKPCPKCASCIFKIDGCDQMWCTMCKTAFSWRTGDIETRVIHNPHFFEYQRTQRAAGIARNIGDIPCGREIDMHNMNYMRGVMTSKNIGENLMLRIHDYMRAASHLQAVVLPTYRPDRVVDYRMLRLKYIASEITEAEFRSRLVRDMKKHDKNIEIGQVLHMLSINLHELIFRFFHEIETLSTEEIYDSLDTLDEIDRLYEYANTCLLKISKVYDSAPIGVRVMDPDSLNQPIHYGTGIYSINASKVAGK